MPPSSTQQFSGIFISYRRDDSSGHAGRLADKLVEHFGRNRIFVDIDTIEPGEDFVTVIENAVGSCQILIAVIGRNWLSANGSGRLDNPNNFVRLEIATALRRDIRVIPVLVQRASMPKPQDLPEDLLKLARRNAVELSDLRWQTDVDQLITVMERVLAKRAKAQQFVEANDSNDEVEDEPPLVAEETQDHRRNVEAEQQRRQIEEVDRRKAVEITQRSAAERHLAGARVGESNFAARENRIATPAPIAGAASPARKYGILMLIAGAFFMVLLAVLILIWGSQGDDNLSPDVAQAATPQPSLATPTPAPPTPTPDVTPSVTPEEVAFSEPTFWSRTDTGTILEIVRNGNHLKAIVASPSATAEAAGRSKGDLAFEGSYEGRTMKGIAYLLFSATDVSRCPAFEGEQPFDLELTLSADGNRLSGSREDHKLSDDCNIIKLPRRRLTYTRTLD